MNIIVDRPQLVRVVLLYLNMNFGNLTPKTNSKYPNSVLYVDSDNKVIMDYYKETGIIWVHFEQIWLKINSLFSLNNSEFQSIMKVWLEETYNLKDLKPVLML